MEDFEGIAPSEITAAKLCAAVDRSLPLVTERLIELMDGEDFQRDQLEEDYLRWALPAAMISSVLVKQLQVKDDSELESAPGLRQIVEAAPEFDIALSEYLDSDGDRELLLLTCAAWMEVREGCYQLLSHLEI